MPQGPLASSIRRRRRSHDAEMAELTVGDEKGLFDALLAELRDAQKYGDEQQQRAEDAERQGKLTGLQLAQAVEDMRVLRREHERTVLNLQSANAKRQQLENEVERYRNVTEMCRQNAVQAFMRHTHEAMLLIEEVDRLQRLLDQQSLLGPFGQCPVCMSAPRDCALSCGHIFCNTCIRSFPESCPVCRTANTSRFVRLYT